MNEPLWSAALSLRAQRKRLNFAAVFGAIMRRSIRNFNIPPRAYPGHLTVHLARVGGEFERWAGRVGNLNRIYLLF